jgi:hypothetical protein
MSEALKEGTKFDTGKCRFDLIPYDALWETGKVYTMGAKKYADRNWEKGISYGRVFSALCRHLFKWFCGERYDPEDGQHHLASVVWGGLTLLHYDLNPKKYAAFDDRPVDHAHVWDTEQPIGQLAKAVGDLKGEAVTVKRIIDRQAVPTTVYQEPLSGYQMPLFTTKHLT